MGTVGVRVKRAALYTVLLVALCVVTVVAYSIACGGGGFNVHDRPTRVWFHRDLVDWQVVVYVQLSLPPSSPPDDHWVKLSLTGRTQCTGSAAVRQAAAASCQRGSAGRRRAALANRLLIFHGDERCVLSITPASECYAASQNDASDRPTRDLDLI